MRQRLAFVLFYHRNWLIDTWWPEAIALLFSACCLVAIVSLLLPYALRHQPAPEHVSGLTLSALTSILAAASKSSLVFSVTATMGHAKWCWFRTRDQNQRRQLQDIQTLDDAARGPLGSLITLFEQTFLSICSIGAFIIVLALAYDPCLQQLVSYHFELTEISTNATTGQAIETYTELT